MNRDINKEVYLILLFNYILAAATAQQNTFKIYTANEGLICNTIYKIFQDKDGFMWFGSNEGLSIYDGNRFTNFTIENKGLSQNEVSFFFEKNENEIWIPHSGGIDVFVHRKLVKTIPLSGINTLLRSTDGRILAAGEEGIYEIKGETKLLLYRTGKSLFNFYEIGGNFIADETSWKGSYLFDPTFHVLDTYEQAGMVHKGGQETYWFYNGKQCWLIDTVVLKKGRIGLKALPPPLQSFTGEAMSYPFMDSDQGYWVSLVNKGILYANNDGTIKKYNISNGLNSNFTSFFFEDDEKNIWVTGNNGLLKFFSRDIHVVSVPDGLASDFVSSVASSNAHQAVWISQLYGISCFYQNKVNNFQYSDHITCTWARILLNGEYLWLGSYSLWLYKIRYHPRPHLELVRHWPFPGGVGNMQIYKDNNILISNSDGLFFIKNKGELLKLAESHLLFQFLLNGDDIWSGGRNGEGAAYWKLIGREEVPKLKLVQQFKETKGNLINCISKDGEGNIWFSWYGSGAMELKKRQDQSFIIRNFSTKDGLGSNQIDNLFVTSKGKIYAGTSHGLSVLTERGDSVFFVDLSRKYSLTTNIFSMAEDWKNDLWLATPSGAMVIKPDNREKLVVPRIFITKVINNNDPDSQYVYKNRKASYSYDRNNFNFEFSATSFRNEEQVLYSYQLIKDNYQHPWSTPSKIHNVTIAGLSPGKYTFLVKALSVDNIWSRVPASYSFVIVPPFWGTFWFRGLFLIILTGIVAGIFWYHIRQIKKIAALRTKISRDLHDEIGSTLSGVNLYSEIAKRQLMDKREDEAGRSLEKIISSSDEMMGKMSDIVWAINPRNDSFEKLIARLKSYTAATLASKNIFLQFEVQNGIDQLNPDMQRRNNIYLICKEAINNAIKYADCSAVLVHFVQQDHHLKITIKDDGKGFDAGNTFDGNGLRNMEERAKEMKGQLTVQSGIGKGTEVCLMVKIT